MELVNDLYAFAPVGATGKSPTVISEALDNLVLMLAPFAPHMSEEMWERLGKSGSLYRAAWPEFDAAAAAEDEITIVIQVNGKLRDRLTVPAATSGEDLKAMALANEKVIESLNGMEARNVIVVPKRLVNVVIG
jgi:leucyl-tRNA synthetase